MSWRDRASRIPAGETVIEPGADGGAEHDEAEPVETSGRLRLIGEIAVGGMGVVFRGRDMTLGRDLAVKFLRAKHRDRPEMIRRFIAEARIAGQLQHPGIVPVHELGTLDDDRPYFTMKLVRGRTLAEMLAERPDPVGDRPHLLTIFLQVVQTVAYAHDHGVIHRDLKPSNIMVGHHGEVLVMDWGLAKVLERGACGPTVGEAADELDDPGPDEDGGAQFMGTPGYMAPERFGDRAETVDERADVFALGAILCEILAARPVYDGDTSGPVRARTARGEDGAALEALRASGGDAPLIALAGDCLAADREARPRHAGAVAARLSAHLEGVAARLRAAELARVEAQARAAEEGKRRRLTALLAALAVMLLTVAVGTSASWLRRREARRAAADLVLREVELLRDEAAADPQGDPERWRAARDALRRAGLLLADAPEATARRLSALTAVVGRGLDRAENDRRLLDRLEATRYRADEGDLRVADAQFEATFREAGLDVALGGSAAVGRAVAARPREVRDEIVAALDRWAIARRQREAKGDRDVASWRMPLDAARAADPDPWRRGLRDALESGDREALARLARADDHGDRPAPSLWLMGRLLIWSGQVELADEFLGRAWRAYPHDFWINLDLAQALMLDPWRPEEALRYATGAVALRPGSAVAHLRLGWIHQVFADKVGAEAEYRAALRLWPGYGRAHARLAGLLFFRSRRAEAAGEYREAIRLVLPEEGEPLWAALGDSLMRLHRLEDAEVELEEAARRYPSSFSVAIQIARLRLAQRDVARAQKALRGASERIRPGTGDAAEVAREWSRWRLLRRLPALLRGEDRPRDNAERLEFARLCGDAGLAAAGARLYAEAIAADPPLAEDRVARPRCYGAFLAAWAGSGTTRDDPSPAEDERARLRRQALDWLRGELTTWIPMLEGGPSGGRRDAAAALRGWMNTHELSGVRDPDSLPRLPEEERAGWRALWTEAAERARVDPG